jgi:hypothetical protein
MSNDKAYSEPLAESDTRRQGRAITDADQHYAGLLAALDALETEFRVIAIPVPQPC